MKIIYSNLRAGEVKLRVENQDDIWILSQIIDTDDLVKSRTLRKIKKSSSDERVQNVTKKPVTLVLKVEKVEFSNTLLKILGIIVEEHEDIPKGSHHSFNVDENSVLMIIKKKWLKFQLDKLNDACKPSKSRILICVMDREEAIFALLKGYNYDILMHLKGKVAKKDSDEKVQDTFYEEIIVQMQEYVQRYGVEHIILASPSFFKEDLVEEIKDETLKKKITQATCSSVTKSAINEVLKRPETLHVLKQEKIAKEINLVEDVLKEIHKEGKAAYGLKEVKEAAEAGAVEDLLITDNFIIKSRENETYNKIEYLMKTVETMKGTVHIISSEHEGGKKLDGLGGIAALLRYKISY